MAYKNTGIERLNPQNMQTADFNKSGKWYKRAAYTGAVAAFVTLLAASGCPKTEEDDKFTVDVIRTIGDISEGIISASDSIGRAAWDMHDNDKNNTTKSAATKPIKPAAYTGYKQRR